MNFFIASAQAAEKLSLWQQIMPPQDVSLNGHKIDWLFNYITGLNIIYFILVCVGLFGFSYKYYYRRHPVPYYTFGNKKTQTYVTLIIGALVFFTLDIVIALKSSNDMINTFWNFPKKDEKVFRVEVMAQQWMWNFRYAGTDELFNTADDIVTNHDLYIPVNQKVEIRMTSKDVIHSFYLPNARQKVDAIPGRLTRMWFQMNQVGDYDLACAEMCGIAHYLMRGRLHVLDEAAMTKWLSEAQLIANVGNNVDNPDHFWGWKWE